jgi:tRNA threonylcarbamoyladenosine biosynthesis protein TsaB
MIVLALEAATSHQSMAIFNDQELLGYLETDSSRSLTTQIIPTIHQLLGLASLNVAALEGLAVSIGPGTFTGLRVGLATMTAFRLALDIPLVGVSTLEGLAWNLPNSDLPILSTVAIREEMVYWGIFRWQENQVVAMKTDQIGKLTDVCAGLSEPTIVLGDGWIRNQECLMLQNDLVVAGPSNAMWPSAQGVGRAGRVLLKKGQFLPEGCTPRYIQPTYAETSQPISSCTGSSEVKPCR